MAGSFLQRNRHVILYGASLAVLLLLLKWLELRFVILNHSFEIYVGTIAILFTGLGIWLALKLSSPKIKTVVVEKEIPVTKEPSANGVTGDDPGLSKRELEVLGLMAGGLSNQEIAERMYVSLSTVKTHAKNVFSKLGVVRRTQAIDKAKRMGIIR